MLVNTVEQDLRILYGNARKMLQSDDVQALYNYLLDDLVQFTGFEKVVVLCKNPGDEFLESQAFYGFQGGLVTNYRVRMAELNGLLRKVYTDREPLAVLDFPGLLSGDGSKQQKCTILRDSPNNLDLPNRRARINLCLSCDTSNSKALRTYDQFRHYSIAEMDVRDKTITSLLGETRSFLILPIYDGENFHGYVLAGNSLNGDEITYDVIRYAFGLVSHVAHALKRACKNQMMLDEIAAKMDEINRLKSYYQGIIHNLRSGLITVDKNMVITEVNRAAEMLLGYGHNELLGQPVSVFLPDLQKSGKCFFVDMVEELDITQNMLSEVSLQKKDGNTFPSEICFSVITDSNENISGLSCIFRDLTARKNLEQDLARVDKLASLGEMAAGVAHEIKNPLAGIAGALQILSRNYQKESPHQYIFNEVQGQVKRIDAFVNDLLKFARPGQTRFTQVDLEEILNKTLLLTNSMARNNNFHVNVDFCPIQHQVMGDDGQLSQAFLNIILNAADSMDNGGKLTISCHCELFNDHIVALTKCPNPIDGSPVGRIHISFMDTGNGIDPQALDSIFNPFHTSKSNGTGLGLSITSRIIEQHGGTILVESTPGVGSTFTVQLPLCGVAGSKKAKAKDRVQC